LPKGPIFGHFIHLATCRTLSPVPGSRVDRQRNCIPTKILFHTEASILLKFKACYKVLKINDLRLKSNLPTRPTAPQPRWLSYNGCFGPSF